MITLLGRLFLVACFFPFSTLSIPCHSLLACGVSAEVSVNILCGFTCEELTFQVLTLSVIFDILLIMCPGVDFLGFILFGALCASWT